MEKILLVEDSDLVADMVTEVLVGEGYDVVRAINGVEGIQKTYSEIPDLIIMDVEMPLIQGYQASRLIKSRRGVKDIPIIMHTSLSEDKDKFWALNSGADAFVNKDFDNIGRIINQIQLLIKHTEYDIELIKNDGRMMDADHIYEVIGSVLDQQLFEATVLNALGEVGRSMGSLTVTMNQILGLLSKVCDVHLGVILVQYNDEPMAFILPGDNVFESDTDEFMKVCLNDFYQLFPQLNLENCKNTTFEIDSRDDYEKMRIDEKKISSYEFVELRGKGDLVIGTLHLGNLHNNYFSEKIKQNINVFADGVGIILENTILYRQVSEMQLKIRHVLSKFVPPEIISDMLKKQTDDALLVGEKREITVLFCDIRQFTTISENNSAEMVVGFLNEFFNISGNIIKKHGGTVNKFIGDAILAIFGAPISYEDNATRAARAAVEMLEAVNEFDTRKLKVPKSGFKIGIGLHSGEAIVGNIGSSDKFDYTAIGDTVNLATRLESLTKHYMKEILISEEVVTRLTDEFFLREVDLVKVKGKAQKTAVFALETEKYTEEYIADYGKAMKLYRIGNWATAVDFFERLLKSNPEDSLVKLFLNRCRRFLQNPPENWDGAIALDFK